MKSMMQVLLFVLLLTGASTPVFAANSIYDRQMAMDLAWELAHPEREIQRSGSGDRHYQNLLTVLITGVELEQGFMEELVAQWGSRYAQDYKDAISWCQSMRAGAPYVALEKYWSSQETMLHKGMVVYQQGVEGVPTHLIRTWAYYYRFYREPQYVPDRWAGGPVPRVPYAWR